jgi:hypothetical protein
VRGLGQLGLDGGHRRPPVGDCEAKCFSGSGDAARSSRVYGS